MREMLFRAKTADENEWIYGDIFHSGAYPKIMRIHDYKNHVNYAVNPETLGQYTGLTDKNGMKIFEGDMIKYEETSGRSVLYGAINFGKYGTYPDNPPYMYNIGFYINWLNNPLLRQELGFWVGQRGIVIIGNIHDNPELRQEDDNEGA